MKLRSTLMIGLLCVLLASGCGKQQGNSTAIASAPNLSTPGFIIDSHTHYRATDEWEQSFLEVYEKWIIALNLTI